MEVRVSDILSLSRAAASFVLLLLEPLSDQFLIAFALIASTDLLDGLFARRFGYITRRGELRSPTKRTQIHRTGAQSDAPTVLGSYDA